MKIETKFNTKDYCYFIKNNKIVKEKIASINIWAYSAGLEIIYTMDDLSDTKVGEEFLFKTKDELIDFLSKS